MFSLGEYESKEKVFELLKNFDKKIWNHCGDNYDTIETSSIFANGGEIQLAYDVILTDHNIIMCAKSHFLKSLLVRHLGRRHITRIQLLDNEEKKGGAILLTVHSEAIQRTITSFVTKETLKYVGFPCQYVVLTIPIDNCNGFLIEKIKQRLSTFCESDIKNKCSVSNDESLPLVLEYINFSQFNEYIESFELKIVNNYHINQNESKCMTIRRNDYSIYKSSIIFDNYLKLKKNSEINIDTPSVNCFTTIKNDIIFDDYLDTKFFESRNVETDGIYDVNGRAFGSLFHEEWLHCDIIDTYLNEWRKRMGDVICNPYTRHSFKVKIYDTFLYTRLTRGVSYNIPNDFNEASIKCLQNNVKRISCEKIYRLSYKCQYIFDFNLLIIPIHINDHWITGVIYQPKNCLEEIKREDDDMMEIDDAFSSILLYDSLDNVNFFDKRYCYTVLEKYIKACYEAFKIKVPNEGLYFNKDKLKFFNINDPYLQQNGYDCGLFMVEFIRQVLINPMSIQKLINGHSMMDVFPNFDAQYGRDYLKLFIYSKIDLQSWIVLYEMEQYFLTNHYEMKFRSLRSRSIECLSGKIKSKVVRRSRSWNN